MIHTGAALGNNFAGRESFGLWNLLSSPWQSLPVRGYRSRCRADETPSTRRSRRRGGRRAGGARGRVARAGAPRRARGTGRRVSGARRPARRAAARGRARAERRRRGRGAGCAAGAHRARNAARAGSRSGGASSLVGVARRRSCAAVVGRRGRAPLGHVRASSFHAALAPTALAPGAQRRGDAHEDVLGLADRARRHGPSPPRRAGSSTRRGCATPPACSCRSGRSTRAGRSRCGRACRRRTSRR